MLRRRSAPRTKPVTRARLYVKKTAQAKFCPVEFKQCGIFERCLIRSFGEHPSVAHQDRTGGVVFVGGLLLTHAPCFAHHRMRGGYVAETPPLGQIRIIDVSHRGSYAIISLYPSRNDEV